MQSITLGHSNNTPIQIPLPDLNNHVAVFGKSGSGKTGTILRIVEQALQAGVPVLLVDVKGDLVNVLRQNTYSALPRLLTPGASHGDPVNLFAKLTSHDRTDFIVTALLKMMGVESNKTHESYHLYLTTIIQYYSDVHPNMQLEELLPLILNPGISQIGMLDIEEVLPKLGRRNLAHKLNNIIASSSFDLWRQGVSLDFDELFMAADAPPVVIYSVAHLVDEEERNMTLTLVLQEYLRWTLKQEGTKQLRSLCVVDECTGIMPPYPKNPSTKTPLLTLLQQARAFGNGIILGTQNPMSIDYKGLAQCQTWIIGQLKTKNDRKRVLEGLVGLDISPKALDEKLASLAKREFVINSGERFAVVKSEDTLCEMSGPMSPSEIVKLRDLGYFYKLSSLLTVRDNLVRLGSPIKFEEPPKPKTKFQETWSNLWK